MTASAAMGGMVFFHPALIVSLLDTLQMISYILYMQINYPVLVKDFFEIFEIFDFDFLPPIVPENKYHTSSPKGFRDNEVDGLFFRNAS